MMYLRLRPDLWEGLPKPKNPDWKGVKKHPDFDSWAKWKRQYNLPIVNALKADGLISPTTYAYDVNIPGLILEAMK